MKPFAFIVLSLAMSFLPLYAQSVRLSEIRESVVSLPTKAELPGFNIFGIDSITSSLKPGDPRLAHFSLDAEKDRFTLRMDLSVVAMASQAVGVASTMIGLSGEITTVQGSFTGRRVGTKFWRSDDGSLIYAVDGRTAIAVYLSAGRRRSVSQPDVPGVITEDEKIFAENLIVQTLDRMTAMGLTSKPAASASDTTKKQVGERLIALRLEWAAKAAKAQAK